MLHKLPFDMPRMEKSEVPVRNCILDETAVSISGVRLPSLAALLRVKEAALHPTGLHLSPDTAIEPFVPVALSLDGRGDSPRQVLGLSPRLAARLIDAALERPELTTAGVSVDTLSQGEIGALLYGLDRAGKDWIAHRGIKFTVRGVLEDTEQIPDYLGHSPEAALAAELRTGDMRYPLRLWYCRAIDRLRKPKQSVDISGALPWRVRIGISVGWSTVYFDELSTLAPGDKIVLDTWNTPGNRGGETAPLFWNGDWCRYGRFQSETAVEIIRDTEREKQMKTMQENGPIRQSLRTVPEDSDDKNLTVTVRVEVGSLKMTVEQALGLIPGRVVQLDREVGPEVHIYVGDKRLGSGTLVDVDGFMAVEIKEIG